MIDSGQRAAAAPLVYVITLNWNRWRDTAECLDSLLRMAYPNYRVLVVDNGSTDGSVERLTERFSDVEIIANEENLGFAAGCNVGIGHALRRGADYVFVVNNDTIVAEDLLDEVVRRAEEPDVGLVAPKVYQYEEPSCIWSVGGQRHPILYERVDSGAGQIDRGQWDGTSARDYLFGCGLLMSRSLLEQIGGFDDLFFMYYEDLDLCIRAQAAGFRTVLAPAGKMWHKGSVSSGGDNAPLKRYHLARSSVLFFRKHVRSWRWLFVVPYRMGSAVLTVFRLLARGKIHSIPAYLRGLRDGMRGQTF